MLKKYNFVKKIACNFSIFFTITAMTLIFTTPVFAASIPLNNDAKVTTTDDHIEIPKTIIASNPDPNITKVSIGAELIYLYDIEPVTPSASNGGTTITDTENPSHTITVQAGPENTAEIRNGEISFLGSEVLDASPSGTANTKTFEAQVHTANFIRPGIYRYKITESASVTPSSIGVVDTNAAEVRYLDVYIENDETSPGNFVVKGYVLHTGTTSNGAPNSKSTFDDSLFPTHNIKITNKVEGKMGNRNNQFKFAFELNHDKTFYGKKGSAPTISNNDFSGGHDGEFYLAHNEEFYFSGLSSTETIRYTEYNNTEDTYKIKIDNGETPIVALTSINSGEHIGIPNTVIGSTNNTVNNVIFTNTLDSVSPTGVIMKYGPYIGIFLASLMLFAVYKRAKRQTKSIS